MPASELRPAKNDSLLSSILLAAQAFLKAVAIERNIRRIVVTALAAAVVCVWADVGYFEILIIQ